MYVCILNIFLLLSGESLSDVDLYPWWWSGPLWWQNFSTQSNRQHCVGDLWPWWSEKCCTAVI